MMCPHCNEEGIGFMHDVCSHCNEVAKGITVTCVVC